MSREDISAVQLCTIENYLTLNALKTEFILNASKVKPCKAKGNWGNVLHRSRA